MVLLLGDQPGVQADVVTRLIDDAGASPIGVCRYADGLGHPFWFGRDLFAELHALHGDKAVWKLLHSARFAVREISVDTQVPIDVDTWDDYQALLEVARGDPGRLRRRRRRPTPPRRDRLPGRRGNGHRTVPGLDPRPAAFCSRANRGSAKTAAAKALARALDAPLIRLQCYEGLTVSEALYEWNYQRQLLAIRLAESRHEHLSDADLFTEEFLQERPILQAIRHGGPVAPVLLIDEIDRADDEFEALLFEFLGEAAITVPELGTFTATRRPVVVLTSNRSRELHDALRRRCLYHWIDFPAAQRAAEILRRSVPTASEPLIVSATEFVGRVRDLDLDKAPGMAETIDWVSALTALGVAELVRVDVIRTLGTIAKTPDDRHTITGALDELGLAEASSG